MDDPFEQIEPVFALKDYKLPRMILSPRHWADYTCQVNLNWQPIPFSADRVADVPNDARGVYTFVVQPGIANHPQCSYLLYVGKVERQVFRDRYRQYLREKQMMQEARRPHISRMLQKWDGYLWFFYAEIADEAQITEVEDALLAAYLPSHNRDFPSHVSYEHRCALE